MKPTEHFNVVVDKSGATRTKSPTVRFMDVAWLRDGDIVHDGEALMLAVLVHAQGRSRESKDATLVRKMMKDINLDR